MEADVRDPDVVVPVHRYTMWHVEPVTHQSRSLLSHVKQSLCAGKCFINIISTQLRHQTLPKQHSSVGMIISYTLRLLL